MFCAERLASFLSGDESTSLRYGIDGEEPEMVREIARRFRSGEAGVREIESKARERLAVGREFDARRKAA